MLSKHVIPGRLKSLYSPLWEWVYLVEKICREWSWKDCPWWYTERALVGTLAAATWYARGVALEEYSNQRRSGAERYLGRCDLYLSMGTTKFIIEAKICWCAIGATARNGGDEVARQLSTARKEVRGLTRYGERRLGDKGT